MIKGQINKVKMLSKHLSNTPDLDPGRHEEGGPDGVGTSYNKLRPSPPTDSPDIQTRRDGDLIPDQTAPSQTPPAPSPDRTPTASSAKTSSLLSEDVASDPEASLSVERMASCSPDSPEEIKASSRPRK